MNRASAIPAPRAGLIQAAEPSVVADAAWKDALARMEIYLRAHGQDQRELLDRLTHEIITEARARVAENPGADPMPIALRVTNAHLGAWFARAGRTGDWSDERVRVGDRLTLVLADLPGNWADHFLAGETVPPELAAALAAAVLQPGPALHFSNMAPEMLEFGFADSAPPGFARASRWSIIPAAAGWLMMVGFFGVAWAAAH